MQVETSQATVVVSFPVLLGLGWGIVGVMLAYGAWMRRPRFLQIGLVLTGLMTLLTPLAWYAYAAIRPDLHAIGVLDVFILALLAFLGGAVLLSGLALPRLWAASPAKR